MGLTVPHLLQDLRAERTTGTLTLTRASERIDVYIGAGEPVFAESNRAEDSLGRMLVRTGKISDEQRIAVEERMRQSGKSIGAVLMEQKLIKPQELVPSAQQQVAEILRHAIAWQDGAYAFHAGQLPQARIVPLRMHAGNLIVERLDQLEWKVVRKALPPLSTVLIHTARADALREDLQLSQDQQTVFRMIDGAATIEQLCVQSEIGDFSTLKAIHVLLALRLVEPGKRPSAEPHPAAAADAAHDPHAKSDSLDITQEFIQHAHDVLSNQDYYEMLGIGRGATPEQIKTAYFSLAKLYHPDRHAADSLAGMHKTLATLFTAITEAFNVLSDRDKREAYHLELANGQKRQGQAEVIISTPQQQHQQNRVSAKRQFDEGFKQYSVNNFWGAEEAFRWAVRLDPKNADYVCYLGMALARMPRRRHEAEEFIVQAVRMLPSKPEFHLELGRFYAANGMKAKALSAYQDALKLSPNSERIQQAIAQLGK